MKNLIREIAPLSILLIPFAFWVTSIGLLLTFKLWLFGSLAVSSVKSLSDSCGKTYPVEVYVINGNWFCSEVKDDNKD